MLALLLALLADVGDPQVRTDDPWYPGELAFSTFERLFETQAELYKYVVGKRPETDEEKALASWLWRNTHYFHCQEAGEHLWGMGAIPADDLEARQWPREYWTGVFARGFGLCFATHAEWAAEMEHLLGHGRARCPELEIHTSFEVFLTGGEYGEGRWALLDHDISNVCFDALGKRLVSLAEVRADPRLADRSYLPERQRGWLPCGLHGSDAGAYERHSFTELLPGYAGPPPAVRLRRGETLRRYPEPGLDKDTYVFWGANMKRGRVPGPERDRTWVNQPDRMHGSKAGSPAKTGTARYGNAVFTYRPDFEGGDYREGIVDEGPDRVVFEFSSPYLIAATPDSDNPWGIVEPGCKNGLVLRGSATCPVAVSVDRGRKWQECGTFADGMDLTDRVKGRRQYLLRLGAGAEQLKGSGLAIVTVCQASTAVVPRLKDDGSEVTFFASGHAVVSAGPCIDQVRIVDGKFGSPSVTLEIATPRGESAVSVFAAAQIDSDADATTTVECSTDGGTTWQPVVKDWTVPRLGEAPPKVWSQAMCFGSRELEGASGAVQVRFHGKRIHKAEAHLVYRTPSKDATKVTFDWGERSGGRRESHVFAPGAPGTWKLETGKGVATWWVEFEPVPAE